MAKIRKFDFTVGVETSTAPTASDPSADGDAMTLGYANNNYVQGGAAVADITALKAVAAADRKDNDLRFVDSTRTVYQFDSSSSATGDDDTVVVPTAGTGRWISVNRFFNTDVTYDNQTETRWREQTGNGTNYVGFSAPDAVTGNQIWKLPNGDGLANQVLATNGSGALQFNTVLAGNNEVQTKSASYTITDGDNARILVFTPAAASTFQFTDADVNTGTDAITETSHGMSDGDPVHLIRVSGSTIPAGLSHGRQYWVVSSDTNTFKLAETRGGSAVDITTTGSGTHIVSRDIFCLLPTAADNTDRIIRIGRTNSNSNRLVVAGESTEFKSGGHFAYLRSNGDYLEVACDGTSWYETARNIARRTDLFFLSSNLSGTSTDNADLRFENLEEGQTYYIEAQMRKTVSNSSTFKDWTILDGGTTVLTMSNGDHESTAGNIERLYSARVYTMSSGSILQSNLNTNLTNGILGNGTIDGTWLRVTEIHENGIVQSLGEW